MKNLDSKVADQTNSERTSGRAAALLGLTALVLFFAAPHAVALAAGQDGMCNGQEATIVGTPGSDFIEGSDEKLGKRDVIDAQAGGDIVLAHGGNDLVCGKDDNDVIDGGEGGEDILLGGLGGDIVFTGLDIGSVHERYENYVYGEAGRDTLLGGTRENTMNGGPDRDLILGAATCETPYEVPFLEGFRPSPPPGSGEAGEDGEEETGEKPGPNSSRTRPIADLIDFYRCRLGGGIDEIDGGDGDDGIDAGGKNDVIYGNDGDDLIYGGRGHDFIDGGDGFDTCSGYPSGPHTPYYEIPEDEIINCELVVRPIRP